VPSKSQRMVQSDTLFSRFGKDSIVAATH